MAVGFPFTLLLLVFVSYCSSLSIKTKIGRRECINQLIGTAAAITCGSACVPQIASAASASPSPTELQRLQKGHARIQYLLDNWDEVTRVCGTNIMSDAERKQIVRTENGGGTDQCSKTPLRVQEFMGYKSIEDPLYKADKLMVRASPLVDDIEGYLNVVEKYRETADQTALLAYTSSWGEANPNGGKEVIDDYLLQTKTQVIESEKLLRSALGFLKLDILPPSGK